MPSRPQGPASAFAANAHDRCRVRPCSGYRQARTLEQPRATTGGGRKKARTGGPGEHASTQMA